MTFNEYLHQKYSEATASYYEKTLSYYLEAVPTSATANYEELIEYIESLRKEKTVLAVQGRLQSIKAYYDWLLVTGKRMDHPAKFIQLKDRNRNQKPLIAKVLSSEELELLWQYFLKKKTGLKILRNRNICLVGLALKQGLRRKELRALKVEDIDLEKGQISVPATGKSCGRILTLETQQMLPFYRYMQEERTKLLEGKEVINTLFITKNGAADIDTLKRLVRGVRQLIKHKNLKPDVLRVSAIAEQFRRGHSLQEVQYFAGHSCPKTTERYKTEQLEALKQSVLKHHPLNDLSKNE